MSSPSGRRGVVGIFFLVLALYIVTYNGAFKSNDERALFSGIDSFIKRGAFTTNQIYWDYTHVGVFTTAGDMVPNYEPAQMVAAIPLYLWGRALGAAVQGVMFFGALVMAAAAGLIYLALLELGCRPRAALFGAFVFAFATAAWPYSRSFFREPLTILAYLVAFYGLFRYRANGEGRMTNGEWRMTDDEWRITNGESRITNHESKGRARRARRVLWLALSGFALGLAITTKQIGVAVAPSLLLLLIVYEWGGDIAARFTGRPGPMIPGEDAYPPSLAGKGARGLGAIFKTDAHAAAGATADESVRSVGGQRSAVVIFRTAGWRSHIVALLAFFLPLAFMLLLNWWYTATTLGGVETFARDVVDYTTNPQLSSSAPERMLRAAIGLTISPYKGLFWFSPALILGLIGALPFIRRRPWEGWALAAAAAIHLLGYSRYNYWSGGVTWGSRYMLQVAPFLILLAAPVWTWLTEDKSAKQRIGELRIGESRIGESRITNHESRLTYDVSRLTSDVPRFTQYAVRSTQYAVRSTQYLLLALSFIIQLLGMAVDYRTFEVKWLLDNAKVWGGIGQAIEGLYMRPAESPVVGHVRLLLSGTQPLDFAWVQLRPEGRWAFVPGGLFLSLLLVGLAALAFAMIWRRPARAGRVGGLMAVATALVCSGLLLIYRQGDARFDPYNVDRFLKPMMAALDETRCSRPGPLAPATCNDVLLVPDPTLTDYFLNYLRAPLVWYSVEPAPVDERLMAQLLARYGRIWLARDRNAQADDTEGRRGWERYLTDHAYKVDERRFEEWARLLRYSAAGRPVATAMPRQALGDMVLETAQLGLEKRPGEPSQLATAQSAAEPLADGKVVARSGDTLQVSLIWRATAPPAGNYTVFVQLLDAASQVKAQVDRWPGDGLYPTAGLRAGEAVTDNVALPLNVGAGRYRLIAGLYRGDQPGYPRLVGPGGDHVMLAEVEVR